MTRYLTVFTFLTACAAGPATSTTGQSLCQRDPVSGQCPHVISESTARSSSATWVRDNYTNAHDIAVGCSRGTSGVGCSIDFTWGDWQYSAGCTWWDDGGFDCYETDGPE